MGFVLCFRSLDSAHACITPSSQLSLPDGAFDCWAYMACNETVLAIMSRVNPDTLVDSTTSLLLVRAELWHYALEKVCRVM